MRRFASSVAVIVLSVAVERAAFADIVVLDIEPGSPQTVPFEVVFQYTDDDGHFTFDVCADSSGLGGRLVAELAIVDEPSLWEKWFSRRWHAPLVEAAVVSEACSLGQTWNFLIREDVLSKARLSLTIIPDTPPPIPSGGTVWVFHLGPLVEESFSPAVEPACPAWHAVNPNPGMHPTFYVLSLRSGQVAPRRVRGPHN